MRIWIPDTDFYCIAEFSIQRRADKLVERIAVMADVWVRIQNHYIVCDFCLNSDTVKYGTISFLISRTHKICGQVQYRYGT